MKTAEEILKEKSIFFKHPYQQQFIIDEAVAAMKEYGEQALDEMRDEILNKQSPLYYGDVLEFIDKVKSELK